MSTLQQTSPNKLLERVPVGSISFYSPFSFYSLDLDSGLKSSLDEVGLLQPVTLIVRDGKLVCVDGNRRVKHLQDTMQPDELLSAWILPQSLTDDQVLFEILHIGRSRQKGCVDKLNEYHLLNKLLPNNQGKSGVDKKRDLIISEGLGYSIRTIRRLLRIDRVMPSLLAAVDADIISLSQAEAKVKKIEYEKKKQEADQVAFDEFSGGSTNEPVSAEMDTADSAFEQPSDDDDTDDSVPMRKIHPRRYEDRIINLETLPTCCPTCNRSYKTISFDEIPEIFNQKREEKDNQTDWLNDVA